MKLRFILLRVCIIVLTIIRSSIASHEVFLRQCMDDVYLDRAGQKGSTDHHQRSGTSYLMQVSVCPVAVMARECGKIIESI